MDSDLLIIFQEKNTVAKKKYDYVFAPPLLPGLLAAPLALDLPPPPSDTPKYETILELGNKHSSTVCPEKKEYLFSNGRNSL